MHYDYISLQTLFIRFNPFSEVFTTSKYLFSRFAVGSGPSKLVEFFKMGTLRWYIVCDRGLYFLFVPNIQSKQALIKSLVSLTSQCLPPNMFLILFRIHSHVFAWHHLTWETQTRPNQLTFFQFNPWWVAKVVLTCCCLMSL